MLQGIKALFHSREYIGLFIRSTKVNYTWKLELSSNEITIVLIFSKITSKIEIFLNNVLQFSGKKSGKFFSYDFSLYEYSLSIVENKAFFDIYIDGLSFLVMYNRQASSVIPNSAAQSFLAPIKQNACIEEVVTEEVEE